MKTGLHDARQTDREDTLAVAMSRFDMWRAEGFGSPLYSLEGSQPIGVLNPFSYCGARTRRKAVSEAPCSGRAKLLQVPSNVLAIAIGF